MKTYFEESDLISFGRYLLSEERTKRITNNETPGDSVPIKERLQEVYHADYENWKEEICKFQTNA
jgi:hypothetical protein